MVETARASGVPLLRELVIRWGDAPCARHDEGALGLRAEGEPRWLDPDSVEALRAAQAGHGFSGPHDLILAVTPRTWTWSSPASASWACE